LFEPSRGPFASERSQKTTQHVDAVVDLEPAAVEVHVVLVFRLVRVALTGQSERPRLRDGEHVARPWVAEVLPPLLPRHRLAEHREKVALLELQELGLHFVQLGAERLDLRILPHGGDGGAVAQAVIHAGDDLAGNKGAHKQEAREPPRHAASLSPQG
jgi:hypothetical protein